MTRAEDEKKVERFQELCRKSLKFLGQGILGYDDWSALHDEIELELDAPENMKLILVPRGHLKSSVITIAKPIQWLLRDPNERILIANAVWDNARHFMWKIQDYLTDKSILPHLFGNFVSKRWNQDEFVIAQRTVAHAEPSIATTGLEKTQTSQHYTKILMDDLVVRENIGTKEQKQKVITFFKDTLDLLEPSGELVIVGTRWANGDLYQYIIENLAGMINGKRVRTHNERMGWRDLIAA